MTSEVPYGGMHEELEQSELLPRPHLLVPMSADLAEATRQALETLLDDAERRGVDHAILCSVGTVQDAIRPQGLVGLPGTGWLVYARHLEAAYAACHVFDPAEFPAGVREIIVRLRDRAYGLDATTGGRRGSSPP